MSSQHPDEHQHNGEGERQELGKSKAPTAAKGNPAKTQTSDTVKTRKQIQANTLPPSKAVLRTTRVKLH